MQWEDGAQASTPDPLVRAEEAQRAEVEAEAKRVKAEARAFHHLQMHRDRTLCAMQAYSLILSCLGALKDVIGSLMFLDST